MTPRHSWIGVSSAPRSGSEVTMNESALASLAALLWDERQQLERLLYCLVTQQLIIVAGQSRWLGHADGEIQKSMTALQDSEVLRAIEVKALVAELGLDDDASLADLAAAVPQPWAQTLKDHRTALRALAGEIEGAVAENRRLLTAGAQAIGDTLDRLGSFASTYDASGGAAHRGDGPTFFDRQA